MSDLAISALASTDLDKPRRRHAAGARMPHCQDQTPRTSDFPRKPTRISPESAVDATDCAHAPRLPAPRTPPPAHAPRLPAPVPPPPAPVPTARPRTPRLQPTNPTAPATPAGPVVVAFVPHLFGATPSLNGRSPARPAGWASRRWYRIDDLGTRGRRRCRRRATCRCRRRSGARAVGVAVAEETTGSWPSLL